MRHVILLRLLLGVFLLRVVGQFSAVVLHTPIVGAQDDWTSGVTDELSATLVPYPALLGIQLVVLALLVKACLDFQRRRGVFFEARYRLGTWLLVLGSLYLGAMLSRYVVRVSLYPAERWAGGAPSIVSHWALAGFLLALGVSHRRRGVRPTRSWALRAGQAAAGLLGLGIVGAWVGYQLAPTIFAHRLGVRGARYAVRVERGVSLKTSDGISLVADVFRPQGVRRTATILVRVNYSKTLENTFTETTAGRLWAEHGYTVVIQGTRGNYESGGVFSPFATERQDGIQTLAWVKRQPWYDGRLGMWGGSYFGYTQWALFDQFEPGSSALDIAIASSDFHGMFYAGGAFSLESALFWADRSHGKNDITPSEQDLARGYRGFPLIQADDRAIGENVGWFDDWVEHPRQDAYWTRVDGSERARKLSAPALLMGGWFDPFLPTELRDFMTIRSDAEPQVASGTRLIIGPWGHARSPQLPDGVTPEGYRAASIAPSVPWFDERLLGREPVPRPAPIRYYVLGANVWRASSQWPLATTQFTPVYLQRSGALVGTQPSRASQKTYFYDPRDPVPTRGGAMLGPHSGMELQNDVEKRPDVLVYSTPPLRHDTEVTGPVKLVLYVSSTAPSTDFTGKLVDVYPDGRAYNISDGILRVALTPHRRRRIEIELWPTSVLFRAGHRIRLEVSSSNYPRFDRNPNTGAEIATTTHTLVAAETVYQGATTPSQLVLPLIPPAKPGA